MTDGRSKEFLGAGLIGYLIGHERLRGGRATTLWSGSGWGVALALILPLVLLVLVVRGLVRMGSGKRGRAFLTVLGAVVVGAVLVAVLGTAGWALWLTALGLVLWLSRRHRRQCRTPPPAPGTAPGETLPAPEHKSLRGTRSGAP